jgi:hypothetical protein
MVDIVRATTLVFDSNMGQILLIKGPKFYPPHVDMHKGLSVKPVMLDYLEDLTGIPTIFQPIWWHMTTEYISNSDGSTHNYIYFAKFSDKEYGEILKRQANSMVSMSTKLLKPKKEFLKIHYWIPMAIYLSSIPHALWPKHG